MKAYAIPKHVEESVFDVAEGGIFEAEKTTPTYSSGVVFSDSNLPPSALSKFRFFNVFGYILSILILVGCSSPQPKEKESLNLYVQTEPISYDPRIGGDRRSQVILRHLFEGLTRIGRDGTAQLALAKSYAKSKKGTVYTFELLNTRWSNGQPVTAYDFEWAWKTLIDPSLGSAHAYIFNIIQNVEKARAQKCSLDDVGIRAIHDTCLEVTLEHPCPYFIELLANPLFSPLCKSHVTQHPDWTTTTYPDYPSNGPYILKEHVLRSHIVLEKNPHYHRIGVPKTNRLYFAVLDDPFTTQLLFDKGEVEWYGDPCGLTPIETIHALGSTLKKTPISAIYWILCNTSKHHLSSAKIRRALAYSINRNVLCQFLKGGETPALTIVTRNLSLLDTPPIEDGRADLARSLFQEGLSELGLTAKTFPPITFSYWSDPACKAVAEVIKEQIEQSLGITVNLEAHDWATQMKNTAAGQFDITTASWFSLAQDPLLSLTFFKHARGTACSTHWYNDAYYDLLDKAESTERDSKRRKFLREAESIIMQEMPAIPLYYLAYKYMKAPYLQGEIVSPSGAMDFSYVYSSNDKNGAGGISSGCPR